MPLPPLPTPPHPNFPSPADGGWVNNRLSPTGQMGLSLRVPLVSAGRKTGKKQQPESKPFACINLAITHAGPNISANVSTRAVERT